MAGIRLLVFLVCSCWLPLWANIPGGPIQVTTAASGGDVTVEAVNNRGNRSQCASFGYDVEFGTETQLAAAEYGYDVDYQQAMAAIQSLRRVSVCSTREATVWASPAEASGEFTGKERDAETGLDYFGARYFSGAQGRFTSPDSPAYSKLSNPQSWNLYAYTLNNPLAFTDPTGHEIVCANNAAQCQKDAQSSVEGGADRVSTTTTTTQHSFLGVHWSTSKTVISISGDLGSFRALGQNASRLADLVATDQTVTVSYDRNAKASVWAQGSTLRGGSTSFVPSQGYDTQAFIDPGRYAGAVYDQDATGQGIPQANTAEEFGHEVLGHIWGELFGGHPAGTRANMRDSITGENAVRKLDPARGQKGLETHHNYGEMPPDPPAGCAACHYRIPQ